MDDAVDHYHVLGLPSGEEGALLTVKDICRGYKQKALELHPDKRPDDPNAHANFQRLNSSFEILKDVKARRSFDDFLRVKRCKRAQAPREDSKRRKMMSGLAARERNESDAVAQAREEDRIACEFQQEVLRFKAMLAGEKKRKETESATGRETVLDVSWKNLFGVGDPAYEDFVLEKLHKANFRSKASSRTVEI